MSIELTLPPDLEAYVREQAASEEGDVSQFLTRLITEERDRTIRRALLSDDMLDASPDEQAACVEKIESQIEQTLLRRLEQDDARPMTREDWQQLRREVSEAAAKRRNGVNHG
jgi:hypothetical protein